MNTKNELEVVSTTNQLTVQQQEAVIKKMNEIDFRKPNAIMMYGQDARQGLSDFSDQMLSEVKVKDGGEAGKLISDLMVNIRQMDANTLEPKKSFLSNLPVIGKLFQKGQQVMMNHETMHEYIEKAVQNMDVLKYGLLKDINRLDFMYDTNKKYFADLQVAIIAGEKKIQEFEETVIKPLQEKVKSSNRPEDVNELNEVIQTKDRFEKRIHDLKLSQTISLQMAPQIRVIQQNDQILVEKMESAINTTIPLWKNQMVLALSLNRQQGALQVQQDVTNTTNNLLEMNSQNLKLASIDVAKANEQGIVNIESLKIAQQNLIETLDETLKIQEEGKQKRMQAEQELILIEENMKSKVLQIAQAKQAKQLESTHNNYE